MILPPPLVLKPGIEQQTPHETFRLVEVEGEYRLEALIREEWKALYRFGLQEQFLVDYEVSSWYLSNHPNSHFITGLIAARTDTGRRYALRNNELAIHYLGRDTEKRVITEVDELEKILSETFGLVLPETEALKVWLKKIVEKGTR